MQIHAIEQGTPEWHQYRAVHLNASDAPAMMGVSPYKTRDQLLAEMYTGIKPNPHPVLQAIYDEGHRTEDLARSRPLGEEIIGDDLYPMVGSVGKLSASFDGLTLDGAKAYEHKMLNEALRECMDAGCTGATLPVVYQVQLEQQCMVSACEAILFMASKWDGDKLVEERHCWYTPNPELAEQITAGWAQFERDLADYRPPVPSAPKTIAETIEALPALAVQIEGRVLASNLPAFKAAAERMIATINTDLQTDQDFANAEGMVKFCKEAEKRLDGVKEQALGQTASIDDLFRTIDEISGMLRGKRLELDKLVAARKDDIRAEIAQQARQELADHAASLNPGSATGWIEPPPISVITDAMKGKKTIDTLRAAANTAVAQAKVAMTQKAARMSANHRLLTADGQQYLTLFPDFDRVGNKAPEDFQALLQLRISNHAKEQAAQRARQAQAEEQQRKQEQQARAAAAPTPAPQPPTSTEALAIDTIAKVQKAVVESERLIRDFIASRKWATDREANQARAVLVEYEKFKARAKAAA